MLVVVELAALDDRVAAPLVFGDRLGAIGVEELYVMQPLAFGLEVLVIDGAAADRLHQLDLRAARRGHRDQAGMRRRLAAIHVVAHFRGRELVDVPRADAAHLPVALHRRVQITHDIGDLDDAAFLHGFLPEMRFASAGVRVSEDAGSGA